MSHLEINSLDWQKMQGLLPAVIQHAENGKVLMLGYMNRESLIATLTSGQLTLYSRRRKRLWRKGEDSGNSMAILHISVDCDNDSLLIQVLPKGAACHLGNNSCYQPAYESTLGSLDSIMEQIHEHTNSDTNITLCAQHTGEKAIELIIAATHNKEQLVNKSADLLVSLLVLLKMNTITLYDVLFYLQDRNQQDLG